MKKIFIIVHLCVFSIVLYSQSTKNIFVAKTAPSWMSNGIIYQVFLRSFTNEGSIKAAAQKLPDIAELGATIIYLSPVMLADTSMNREYWSPRQISVQTNNPRNPYRLMDYYKIDPEYGTEEDLKKFVITAHQLGLHVLLDLVFLHSGPSHVLARNHPEYYKQDSIGNFLKGSWNFLEFNYENYELREYLMKNMEYWIKEFNVDGFRCDVSHSIPVDFWEGARERIEKINPNLGMLAEGNSPDELLRAFDVSYGVHVWYYALRDVVQMGTSASMLQETWETQNNKFPENALFIRYSDNHDFDRTDMVFSKQGSKAVNVLNFMLDGVPFIYNGQEIADGAPIGIWAHWPILWEAGGVPDKRELRNWYKELIALRKNNVVLTEGQTIWLETNNPESVVAFLRKKIIMKSLLLLTCRIVR